MESGSVSNHDNADLASPYHLYVVVHNNTIHHELSLL